ncbi:hypothetical protein [Streptomyces erythrochromogenes]|uniref:hypothetical protein n=1 Tax=Streptomyces erythrochromogenes TaxID=285574 RepID=UPI0036F9E480
MARAGRLPGPLKGRNGEANALAQFLRELTAESTVSQLEERYRLSRSVWSEYRSGLKIIPLARLTQVVEDRFPRDARMRGEQLVKARRLHTAAVASVAALAPGAPAPGAGPVAQPKVSADSAREKSSGTALPASPTDVPGDENTSGLSADNPLTSEDVEQTPADPSPGVPGPSTAPGSPDAARPRGVRLRRWRTPAQWAALAVLVAVLVIANQTDRSKGEADTAFPSDPGASAPAPPDGPPSTSATDPSAQPSSPNAEAAPPPGTDPGPRQSPAAPADNATGPAYALSTDGSTLLRWSGSGDTWAAIGTGVGAPYAGKPGVFALDEKTGHISRYNGTPNSWTRIGTASEIAIGGSSLYALTPARDKVLRWNGQAGSWTTIGGPAGHIYAGGAGLFATEPAYGHLIGYDSNKKTWTRVGNPGAHFVVGPRHLYGLNPARDLVWQWSGSGDKWDVIGGPARAIHGGELGLFAVNPQTGRLWQYTGEPNIWADIGDSGAAFAMDNRALYRVAADGKSVWQWSPAGDWSRIGGPAAAIAAGG